MAHILEVVCSTDLKVDKAEGVIRGVKILGPASRNGRRYSPEAIRRARGLYEGARVNFDHPPRSQPDRERTVGDRAGWLENVRESAGGLAGDLRLLTSDPRAGKVLEAAEKRPELFGLSHNAEGVTTKQGSETIVEEITSVRSVDIVSDPATTLSLFESLGNDEHEGSKPMKTTVKKLLEGTRYAKLFEEEGMAPMGDMPAEAPTGGNSDDAIKAAFRQMVIAAFDDEKLDTQATLARIKEVLKAQERLMGGGAEKKPAEGGETKPTQESVEAGKLKAENAALKLLMESGVADPDGTKAKALAALESIEDRKALLATWPAGGTSGGSGKQKPPSIPLRESAPNKIPETTEAFCKSLR